MQVVAGRSFKSKNERPSVINRGLASKRSPVRPVGKES